MGTSKRSQSVSSDREKWEKVFGGLVKLLKNQQEQLETLVQERKTLEDRINLQHERWVSDIRHYEDHISQMKGELEEIDVTCLLEAAKSNLILGLKQREASVHKLKLEQTEDELADFRAWFDYLSRKLKENSEETGHIKGGTHSNVNSADVRRLEGEVKSLKLEHEKLASDKSSEISALKRENSFLWNQYNLLETNLTSKLKIKEAEVEQANEKMAKVLAMADSLQSSNNKKDEVIHRLKTKVAEMETNKNKWQEETLKLSRQLELLRKSKSAQVTPVTVMKPCSERTRSSSLGIKSCGTDVSNNAERKGLSAIQVAVPSNDVEKGNRNVKNKRVDVITISESPKLFTASFKVPKLKSSSTPVR